jgi:hypothetical protein
MKVTTINKISILLNKRSSEAKVLTTLEVLALISAIPSEAGEFVRLFKAWTKEKLESRYGSERD